jgi:hypothetical protein
MKSFLDFLADPPLWVVWTATIVVGMTLVWVVVSFTAGHINQGI